MSEKAKHTGLLNVGCSDIYVFHISTSIKWLSPHEMLEDSKNYTLKKASNSETRILKITDNYSDVQKLIKVLV